MNIVDSELTATVHARRRTLLTALVRAMFCRLTKLTGLALGASFKVKATTMEKVAYTFITIEIFP